MSSKGSQQFQEEKENSESGQATFEYMIVLLVAVTFAVNISRTIISGLDKGMLTFGGKLEKSLKTGRAPLSAWRN